MPQSRAKHGALGVMLGLVTLVFPGALGVLVGVLRDSLPQDWLQYRAPLTADTARGLVLVLGIGLLLVARGYFSFWRIGWLGYVAWAVVGVITFVGSLTEEAGVTAFDLFPLIVVLGVPYLWRRRRDYGIGPQPNLGGH